VSTPIGFDTPLCTLLGCKYPVIQTAMGWVAGSSLVAATTNAGGFGFLAGATIDADKIEAEIVRVKTLTQDRPFGLNFHMFQPNAQQLLDLAVKHKVRAVSYGRGPDKKPLAACAMLASSACQLWARSSMRKKPSRWAPMPSPSKAVKAVAIPALCRPPCSYPKW